MRWNGERETEDAVLSERQEYHTRVNRGGTNTKRHTHTHTQKGAGAEERHVKVPFFIAECGCAVDVCVRVAGKPATFVRPVVKGRKRAFRLLFAPSTGEGRGEPERERFLGVFSNSASFWT